MGQVQDFWREPQLQLKTYMQMSYGEFENLVNANLQPSPKFGKYEFPPMEECGNDTSHIYMNIQAKDISTEDEAELEAGEWEYRAYDLLAYLVKKEVLEPGDYLINVSW